MAARSLSVERTGDLEDVVLGERQPFAGVGLVEFLEQQRPDRLRHRLVHFEAHHLAELPVAHFLLDQREQVFGLVAGPSPELELEVGVAGDPEEVPAARSARRGRASPGARRSGTPAAGTRSARWSGTQRGSSSRDLHARKALLALRRRAGRPPARARGSRCAGRGAPDRPPSGVSTGKTLRLGSRPRRCSRSLLGEVVEALVHPDAVRGERRDQLVHEAARLLLQHPLHGLADGVELRHRRHPVGGVLGDLGAAPARAGPRRAPGRTRRGCSRRSRGT